MWKAQPHIPNRGPGIDRHFLPPVTNNIYIAFIFMIVYQIYKTFVKSIHPFRKLSYVHIPKRDPRLTLYATSQLIYSNHDIFCSMLISMKRIHLSHIYLQCWRPWMDIIWLSRIYMLRKLSHTSPIEAHGHFPPSVTSTQQGLLGHKVFLSTATDNIGQNCETVMK